LTNIHLVNATLTVFLPLPPSVERVSRPSRKMSLAPLQRLDWLAQLVIVPVAAGAISGVESFEGCAFRGGIGSSGATARFLTSMLVILADPRQMTCILVISLPICYICQNGRDRPI
jgi:hypothetical protein